MGTDHVFSRKLRRFAGRDHNFPIPPPGPPADYREAALERLPWICARCAREPAAPPATHKPFADLGDKLKKKP